MSGTPLTPALLVPPPLPATALQPAAGRVLVVAPHPDDDVIGCGGTLALHVQQGDPVHVLVLTNGAAGDPAGHLSPSELKSVRQHEARSGGAVLGIEHYDFWDYPDGMSVTTDNVEVVAERLRYYLERLRPETLYYPWGGETHLDHFAAFQITRAAIERLTFAPRLVAYEVWSACVPNLIVDISRTAERKAQALRQHQSQLRYADLVTKMLGLNAHRSIYLEPGARYGEAFIVSNPGQ